MSVGAIGAPRVADQQGSVPKAVVGTLAGVALGTGVAVAGATRLAFPAPVAIGAGLVVGGPIAAISLMNNMGEPSKAWQSTLVGATPFAAVGAALGAFAALSGNGGRVAAQAGIGAAMFGAIGAGIGIATHFATKPS